MRLRIRGLRIRGLGLLVVCLTNTLTTAAVADDSVAKLIDMIRLVNSEGAGHREAQEAWRKLSLRSSADLSQILAGFDDANPLAANWLRSAVESILARENNQGLKLPAAELERYLADTRHDPRARRFAFELIVKADPTARERLISRMVNDPSVELRREAVKRVIDQAQAAAGKKQSDEAKTLFGQAMNHARDPDQIELLVKRLKELGIDVDLPRHFGFLMTWKVVGAFDNTGMKGFAAVFPPEERIDFSAAYTGKDGKSIRWKDYTTTDSYGSVDLNNAVEHKKEVVGFAATEFVSSQARDVEFRLGTGNAWKVWLNGKLLFSRGEYHRGKRIDQYRLRAQLKEGKNTILVKLCQDKDAQSWTDDWQFQFRVCDASGTAILSTDRPAATAPKTAQSRLPVGDR